MNELSQKWVFVLVLTVTVVLASFPLHAQQAPQQRGKTILDYKDELKLTNVQVEKIKAYLFDLGKELRELRGKLASVNRESRGLLQQGTDKQGNLKLLEVKIREAYQVRANMAIAEIRTAEKINKALTPEQFEKWKKITQERGGKR
jgi:3-deoxy-D-arabino-heptulosonate 7-phosphate (DAHP) synthase class II